MLGGPSSTSSPKLSSTSTARSSMPSLVSCSSAGNSYDNQVVLSPSREPAEEPSPVFSPITPSKPDMVSNNFEMGSYIYFMFLITLINRKRQVSEGANTPAPEGTPYCTGWNLKKNTITDFIKNLFYNYYLSRYHHIFVSDFFLTS